MQGDVGDMTRAIAIRERFEDLTAGFRSLSSQVGELASLHPIPEFGSPVQQSSKADYSWWHVPVAIRIGAPWQRQQLAHCTVHLLSPALGGAPINLSWKTGNGAAPTTAVTLDQRSVALVPVVARREAADGLTLITNETYFRDKKVTWSLSPRRYTWKLELRSGGKSWESPHFYVLNVPPKGQSNGHFTLELHTQDPD